MSTAPTTVAATVKQDGAVFVCTLNGVELGRSKHNDYFEYHAKRGDVKALREANLTHINYVDAAGTVTTVRIKDEPVADATAAIAATVAAATAPADTTPAAAATPAAAEADAEAVAA